MAYPPPTLSTALSNTTPSTDNHPGYHNAERQAINDVVAEMQRRRGQFVARTSGNMTVGTTFVFIHASITLPAVVGDLIEASVNFVWGNEAVVGRGDLGVLNGANGIIRQLGSTTQGLGAWEGTASTFAQCTGPVHLTVASGDLISGSIKMAFIARTDSGSKTIIAGAQRFEFAAVNLGAGA